ncbi:hypothetical protein LOTGIDRAFT_202406, partial [Lottia gigantea]
MASKVFSEFVQQKVRMWFKMMDSNQNGSMGLDDFTLVAERFGKAYQLSVEEKNTIQKWLGNDMETGTKVSENRFVAAFGEFVTSNPNVADDAMREMVGVYFDIFDHDKDGVISPDEMKIGLKCFGMQGEMAEALGVLFTDCEGKKDQITRQCYVDMWVDFLVGED